MVIPARPALTTDELLALAQTLPLPVEVRSFLDHQP